MFALDSGSNALDVRSRQNPRPLMSSSTRTFETIELILMQPCASLSLVRQTCPLDCGVQACKGKKIEQIKAYILVLNVYNIHPE